FDPRIPCVWPLNREFSNLQGCNADNCLFPEASRFPGLTGQERPMAAAIIQANGRIRIELSPRWYMRLLALPVLAASLCFLVVTCQILRQDLFGGGYWREDWVGLVMCLVLALIIGLPGLVLATGRYFVDLDRILQQVIVTKKFGPVKFESLRKL